MAYHHFAYVYDELMLDAPYHEWVQYVKKSIKTHKPNATQLIDIGCGTGEITIRLAKEGFRLTGVDLSEDMLAVAAEKAMTQGLTIPWFQQDMSQLEGFSSFDVAFIFCDSLNYLATKEQVRKTFERIHSLLVDDGLFLFDVHSLYKMEEVFGNHLFGSNDEECSFLWQCQKGEVPYSVEHDLTFFVYDEEIKAYDRFDEWHQQRTFPIEDYKSMLREVGFEVCEVLGDFEHPAQREHERIIFMAKKAN